MSEFKWYYAEGEEAEVYKGACDTREEAVAECLSNGEPGEVWSIVEVVSMEIPRLNAEAAIERLTDHMLDEGYYGDDGDNPLACDHPTLKAAEAELQTAMDDWLDKHRGLFRKPWLFGAMRNHEVVTTFEVTGEKSK